MVNIQVTAPFRDDPTEPQHTSTSAPPDFSRLPYAQAGLRIRIHFIRIRIQHFRLNTNPDPDPILIKGFNDQKLQFTNPF
jgi:hypothetical protein